MYTAHNSMYPFPALWQATTATTGLLKCLEPHDTLLTYIDTFARTAIGFACPFLPEELGRKEVESFLEDAEQNALTYPDALALIFAGAALGIQLGKAGESTNNPEDRLRRGDVFRKFCESSSMSELRSRYSCRSHAVPSGFFVHESAHIAGSTGFAHHWPVSHE